MVDVIFRQQPRVALVLAYALEGRMIAEQQVTEKAEVLQLAFEQLRARLAEEGLFESERKRPLPLLPQSVGVVTSPTGAVIRDMLAGFTERFPAHVIVWPARVQGEGSAAEVAAGIRGGLERDGSQVITGPC